MLLLLFPKKRKSLFAIYYAPAARFLYFYKVRFAPPLSQKVKVTFCEITRLRRVYLFCSGEPCSPVLGASRVPHPTSSQVSLCALIFLFGKSALLRETCSSPTKIHGFLSVILFDWLYGTAPSTHRLHTTRQNGQTLFARFAINHYFYKINICVLLSYSISSISGKRRKR